ncbi:HAD family hydrolase [Rhabdothermincola sediminis]|uniref:HAD family hydrolase n=1 Tax=Rhabdothermincola sediminis TaxID=2751370 RepID=UPI001AA08CAC|nr:HAD family phosphatase [Rhabdothermincola sediminis]
MTIEAIVFDFGGVFTPSPFDALRAVGEEVGATFEDALDIVFGPYDRDTDHPWHRCERGELDLETARAEIRALGSARGLEIELYDLLKYLASDDGGVRTAVVERTRRLREQGYLTGLVTNNVAEFREYWRAMLPVDELFHAVVDSSEVGLRKPDPAIYELALARLGGVAPERAVFLDDYPGNVEAARRVGMHGVVVGSDPAGALAELESLLDAATPR